MEITRDSDRWLVIWERDPSVDLERTTISARGEGPNTLQD